MNQMENKEKDIAETTEKFLDGELFANMVRGGAAQLRSNADVVNNLNVFPVPDGDTGDNMSMTIEGGVAALEGMHTDNLADVTQKLSQGMLLGARGNSGVILSQLFAGIAENAEAVEHQLGVVAVSVVVELREDVVPDFHVTVTVTSGTAVGASAAILDTTVKIDFGAGAARTGAMLPEVVCLAETGDLVCGNADLLVPDFECFVIIFVD